MGNTPAVPSWFTFCGEGYHNRDRVESEFLEYYGKPRPAIEHVVLLMLENRTFDNIYGNWMEKRMDAKQVEPSRWDVNYRAGKRLHKDYFNVVKDRSGARTKFPVWSCNPQTEDIFSHAALGVPMGDPAEKFVLLNQCIYGKDDPTQEDPVTFEGFAQQYYEREMHDLEELDDEWEGKTDFVKKRSPAMHIFLPEQAGIFTQLGEEFGVSDTYFASAPCQTWPNRLFAMTGHCYGYVNNLSDHGKTYDHDKMNHARTAMRMLQFKDQVIFQKLLTNGVEYSIYAGDCPLQAVLSRFNDADDAERTYSYTDFAKHVSQGFLAPFTWIEPQYLQHGNSAPNDMHPPHNILHAQKLVADTYNALRSNEELWKKTLFIVNCDEGVGVFDHIPPPAAPHPEAGESHLFIDQQKPSEMGMNPFERYGTRTPCLLATPLLNQGSVVRPDADDEYPFDHCSVIRTVLDLFVGPPERASLTNRDYNAPSFAPQLLTEARSNLGPRKLGAKDPGPPPAMSGRVGGGGKRTGCHNAKILMNLAKAEEKGSGHTSDMAGVINLLAGSVTSGHPSHLSYRAGLKAGPNDL
jgi:phospholipase C